MSSTPPPGIPADSAASSPQPPAGDAMTTRIQPILVPLDGSDLAERALPYAEALAGPDCQLILLEVGQDEDDFHLQDQHADGCARLETVTGDPAQQILQVATKLGVGLIVMTTHGRGALGRWAFGSVADTVSRTSPVPVMIIRPQEDSEPPVPVIRRIVAPLDGSSLAERALPTAASLARQLGIPVHLLTATDLSHLLPVGLTPVAAFNADVYEQTASQAQHDAEEWLSQAATQLQQSGIEVTQEVRVGAPFTAIEEIVEPGDVLVLVSRGRHGAARLVLGSLAEQLIRQGSAPVVLVPPGNQASE